MRRWIAEFEKQSFVQLIFPHKNSDWADYLEAAQSVFVQIAEAVARHQPCLIVCDDVETVRRRFEPHPNLRFVEYAGNDTWARDCSALGVLGENGHAELLDFTFNGWGGKFDAALDNAMSAAIRGCYGAPMRRIDTELEGGAIDTNGEGVVLTTAECLLNPNRNGGMSREAAESLLRRELGMRKCLWLHSGYLAGDDTDSHVDTLARFIDQSTIMYVRCDDAHDEHYEALSKMRAELETFTDLEGRPFRLIALPMSDAVYYDGERLPATYANFLIINDAVLVPVYNVSRDAEALAVFAEAFPDREIVPIDCSVLIRQHGSLHCVSMQFPECVGLTC